MNSVRQEHKRFVDELEACGILLHVFHFRIPEEKTHLAVVLLKERDEAFGYIGTAVCGKHDNYSRKIGYTIAVGRALKAAYAYTVSSVPDQFSRRSFAPWVWNGGLGTVGRADGTKKELRDLCSRLLADKFPQIKRRTE